MSKSNSENNGRILWGLLIGVPLVLCIVYLKLQVDEGPQENVDVTDSAAVLNKEVAVPDTSVYAEYLPETVDTVFVPVADSVGVDRRPAMEAGDEDGYWDGWYDGAETGERLRYDEGSNFNSAHEREVYAANYREGYEKGFKEAVEKKKKV